MKRQIILEDVEIVYTGKPNFVLFSGVGTYMKYTKLHFLRTVHCSVEYICDMTTAKGNKNPQTGQQLSALLTL